MIAINPLTAAVSAHRAAWDAFQVAPGGDESAESMDACCAMGDALDGLVLAACAFPILTRPLPAEAGLLLDHLRWWLAEEAEFAADYQPSYGILQGRTADLAAVLEPPAVEDAEPVVAAIVAADMAAVAHSAALVFRDEDDVTDMERTEAAGHAVDAAFKAVQALMPATLAGLHALVTFYARDAKIFCRWDTGGEYLGHVAAALGLLIARESTGRFPASEYRFSTSGQEVGQAIPQQVFGGAR